jgi:hypothetical protein
MAGEIEQLRIEINLGPFPRVCHPVIGLTSKGQSKRIIKRQAGASSSEPEVGTRIF